jgi:hypothetical protein
MNLKKRFYIIPEQNIGKLGEELREVFQVQNKLLYRSHVTHER